MPPRSRGGGELDRVLGLQRLRRHTGGPVVIAAARVERRLEGLELPGLPQLWRDQVVPDAGRSAAPQKESRPQPRWWLGGDSSRRPSRASPTSSTRPACRSRCGGPRRLRGACDATRPRGAVRCCPEQRPVRSGPTGAANSPGVFPGQRSAPAGAQAVRGAVAPRCDEWERALLRRASRAGRTESNSCTLCRRRTIMISSTWLHADVGPGRRRPPRPGSPTRSTGLRLGLSGCGLPRRGCRRSRSA